MSDPLEPPGCGLAPLCGGTYATAAFGGLAAEAFAVEPAAAAGLAAGAEPEPPAFADDAERLGLAEPLGPDVADVWATAERTG